MPFIFGIGKINPLAMWLSVVFGVAAFLLTVITDHNTGIFRILPYKAHLKVDFIVGVGFVAAPFALGFVSVEFWYFILLGSSVLAVVGLHKPEPISFIGNKAPIA